MIFVEVESADGNIKIVKHFDDSDAGIAKKILNFFKENEDLSPHFIQLEESDINDTTKNN